MANEIYSSNSNQTCVRFQSSVRGELILAILKTGCAAHARCHSSFFLSLPCLPRLPEKLFQNGRNEFPSSRVVTWRITLLLTHVGCIIFHVRPKVTCQIVDKNVLFQHDCSSPSPQMDHNATSSSPAAASPYPNPSYSASFDHQSYPIVQPHQQHYYHPQERLLGVRK